MFSSQGISVPNQRQEKKKKERTKTKKKKTTQQTPALNFCQKNGMFPFLFWLLAAPNCGQWKKNISVEMLLASSALCNGCFGAGRAASSCPGGRVASGDFGFRGRLGASGETRSEREKERGPSRARHPRENGIVVPRGASTRGGRAAARTPVAHGAAASHLSLRRVALSSPFFWRTLCGAATLRRLGLGGADAATLK